MKNNNLALSIVLVLSFFIEKASALPSNNTAKYDEKIQAISPEKQPQFIGLAGEKHPDIARFLLAENQGVKKGLISPDGKYVAFTWAITGKPQLWLTKPTGGQPKQLTFGNGVTFFKWSLDSQYLLYGADNNGDEREAYFSITLDGNQEHLVLDSTSSGFRRFGDFINNTTIAYSSTERNGLDFDIYSTNLTNNKAKRLMEGKFGFYTHAASPSGRYIIISEAVGEDSDNLFLFDIKTQKLSTLSVPKRRSNHTNGGFQWTKDEKGFYLSSNLNKEFNSLMYFSLDEGFKDIASFSAEVNNVGLCGEKQEYLYWTLNQGGYSELYVKNRNTNETLFVPPLLNEGVIKANCGGNTLLVSINTWHTPTSLYSWNLAENHLHNTFVANLAGLNKRKLVKPESIIIPARDGVQLQGLLYLPTSKSNKKPPVLFSVHGGPTSQSRPYFSGSIQYLVNQGFAVFLPNVRGSTGFGHTYTTLDDQQNRLESIADLIDMLNYLALDGRVDTTTAAIKGQSYGGYAVNAALANFPGHFKVGIARYGVADWVTALQIASPALKASDRIEYGDIRKKKWLDFYSENSPIVQADQIKVPVLYSHGINDPRVDISETETMVKTLRKNGIEAPFIRFNDEGHGWTKFSNKLFYYQKEVEFLKLHLNVHDKTAH